MGCQDVDLLGWLRERDQQSGGAAVGSPKPTGAVAPDAGSSAPKHQQAAEVRPYLLSKTGIVCPGMRIEPIHGCSSRFLASPQGALVTVTVAPLGAAAAYLETS